MSLTERQARELEYHAEHAREHHEEFSSVNFDVLNTAERRWWNAYWEMFRFLRVCELPGKKALVVGCGAGHDALYIAKLGAEVHAFDLSPELLDFGRENARACKLTVDFQQMTAEELEYPDNYFDFVLVVDILHHCEMRIVLGELQRVSKADARWFINEVYTHSAIQKIRNSYLVSRWIYPLARLIIYRGRPYITEDERKLNEADVSLLRSSIKCQHVDFYEMLVKRILPNRRLLAKVDRVLLLLLRRFAHVVGGRVLMMGTVCKVSTALSEPSRLAIEI